MNTPTFTVLTPVFHPDVGHFRSTIASVVGQSDPDWELILVLDGPHPPAYASIVRDFADDRIRMVERDTNGGISAASNDGLAISTGEFVAFLDHDDTLASFALISCRMAIEEWPDTDVLYSDEDKIDTDGRRNGAFCKPQFSPDWLRCHMYLNHLTVYRRSLVQDVGGFRPEMDGAQDHDLALRATERARRVIHIPRILYHWRQSESSTAADPESKSWAYEAGVRVVADALERQGVQARAIRRPGYMGIVDLVPQLRSEPLVSIIVPTAGGSRLIIGERIRLIDRCLQSIAERSTYPNYEVVVVLDLSTPADVVQQLRDLDAPHVRFVHNTRPFNFSEACNLGRDHSSGEVLVFLNDDTEVVTPDWLERLIVFATLDGVGAVGVKLLYSDGRIQHMGLSSRNGFGHRAIGRAGDDVGPYGSYTVQTNVLCVTGACLAIQADRFDLVGGFTSIFPLAFNDLDLCLKLYRIGLRTMLEPQVTLVHHESSSRDPKVSDAEMELLFDRWRNLIEDDPYDNPHLRYSDPCDVEQQQPPAYFLQLKELVGLDYAPPRAWPPN